MCEVRWKAEFAFQDFVNRLLPVFTCKRRLTEKGWSETDPFFLDLLPQELSYEKQTKNTNKIKEIGTDLLLQSACRTWALRDSTSPQRGCARSSWGSPEPWGRKDIVRTPQHQQLKWIHRDCRTTDYRTCTRWFHRKCGCTFRRGWTLCTDRSLSASHVLQSRRRFASEAT